MTPREQYETAYRELRERRQRPFSYYRPAALVLDVVEHCDVPITIVLAAQTSLRQRDYRDIHHPVRRRVRWQFNGWPVRKLNAVTRRLLGYPEVIS